MVEPIGASRRREVMAATGQWIERAGEVFSRSLEVPEVLFDLKGRCAGMYRLRRGQRVIRYNPWLFARYYEENLEQTVPHEVAHYVADCLYGAANIRPHGSEWQAIMGIFGVPAERTCQFDMTGIPQRRISTYAYRCACPRTHVLTAYRHNKVLRNRRRYACRLCGSLLEYDRPQADPESGTIPGSATTGP